MKAKAEILMSINAIKAEAENASFLSKTQATDSVKTLLKTSKTAEEFYYEFGKCSSEMESEFNNIFFREDRYDYLAECGMPEDKAFGLTDIIRKGRFRFLKDTAEYESFLEKPFINWAKGVQYLPYREKCVEMFRVL